MISVFFWNGPEDNLLRECLAGEHDVVTSKPLLSELARVLEEKFDVPELNRLEFVDTLKAAAIVVDPVIKITHIIDDPDDDRVLECAVAGNADTIVTGDRHLLQIEEFQGITITSARMFMAYIG